MMRGNVPELDTLASLHIKQAYAICSSLLPLCLGIWRVESFWRSRLVPTYHDPCN